MTYEDLLGYCKRAVGVTHGEVEDMHTIVQLLPLIPPSNRAIAAEMIARYMSEFIEGQRAPVSRKTH